MLNHIRNQERRRDQRAGLELPIKISVGSQITVLGHLKDLSLSSAFIKIKSNIFLNVGDEINLTIESSESPGPSESSSENAENGIQILARVCRIVPAEGLAVYFLNTDENALKGLKIILKEASK